MQVGDIVRYPKSADEPGLIGVVLSHEDWAARYGTDRDGLGPENWPDTDWVGVWFPGEDGMLGQYGDLDRAGPDFWESVRTPYAWRLIEPLVREASRQLAARQPKAVGTVKVTVRPIVIINQTEVHTYE